MEALTKVAKAYYNSGTDKERDLFTKFFRSMDEDRSGRVSYDEFFDFMSLAAHDENMRTHEFFTKLGQNKKGLDSDEVLTLYYILKSGRPICGRCKRFQANEYFTCMRCFAPEKAAYSICLECFGGKGGLHHDHDRSHFVDNFSLLESLRKHPLPHHQPSSGSSTSQGTDQRRRSHSESRSNLPTVPSIPKPPAKGRPSSGSSTSQGTDQRRHSRSESPSNLAVVPYNPNPRAEGRIPWLAAFGLLEAGVHLASIVAGCSIM